jgi:hypothetical protein
VRRQTSTAQHTRHGHVSALRFELAPSLKSVGLTHAPFYDLTGGTKNSPHSNCMSVLAWRWLMGSKPIACLLKQPTATERNNRDPTTFLFCLQGRKLGEMTLTTPYQRDSLRTAPRSTLEYEIKEIPSETRPSR